MTEKTPTTLDQLWDDIPTGRAPIADLLTAGQAAKRRQRRALVGGVAVATMLILGMGALSTQALGGHDEHSGLVADGTSHGSGPGTRLVGIGRAAVAVPSSWAENAASCNSPFKDTAFFPWPQDCVMARHHVVSSVAITTGEFTETGTRLGDLHPAGSVGNHQVVDSEADCIQGFPASGQGGSTHCTQTFGIPDLHAYFTASIVGDDVEHRLNAIRESLTVLPEDQVTVPFVTPGTSLDDVRATLEAAGLAVEVVRWACPVTADCVGGANIDHPTVGSVVPGGSTVTVKVLDNEGTDDNRQAPCGPNDLCLTEKAFPGTLMPDCQGNSSVSATFDIFDNTAFATPERAVAPMLAADERASAIQDVDAGMVRIALLRPDSTTRAVVAVERVATGWRPHTINGCPGEMPGRQH